MERVRFQKHNSSYSQTRLDDGIIHVFKTPASQAKGSTVFLGNDAVPCAGNTVCLRLARSLGTNIGNRETEYSIPKNKLPIWVWNLIVAAESYNSQSPGSKPGCMITFGCPDMQDGEHALRFNYGYIDGDYFVTAISLDGTDVVPSSWTYIDLILTFYSPYVIS